MSNYPTINNLDKNTWKVNSSYDSPTLTLLAISKSKLKQAVQ